MFHPGDLTEEESHDVPHPRRPWAPGQLMATMPRYQPSAGDPLFIMAMDHRASFVRSFVGISAEPTAAELRRLQDAKEVIYDGARQVAAEGIPLGRIGVLVDEKFGSEVAEAVKSDGLVLAMPIERSGTRLFELDYGDRFAEHVERFDPDFFKVLVRYNPADDEDDRNAQLERLARVSDWAERTGRRWLFELLVPPTRAQLSEWEDQDHFDRNARPTLTAEVLTQLQAAGVRPTIWKLEGYETAEGARAVLKSVADGSEHPAECIVLGRNAPLSRVEHWIDVAAPLQGYAGFAVGRSNWERPLEDLFAGRLDRSSAGRADRPELSNVDRDLRAGPDARELARAPARNRSPGSIHVSPRTGRTPSESPWPVSTWTPPCCRPGWRRRFWPRSTRCGTRAPTGGVAGQRVVVRSVIAARRSSSVASSVGRGRGHRTPPRVGGR